MPIPGQTINYTATVATFFVYQLPPFVASMPLLLPKGIITMC